ncbi:hypothetical protein ASPTUDRAFT_51742, partial [Aspergillus tubingensis CBS 134.48]
ASAALAAATPALALTASHERIVWMWNDTNNGLLTIALNEPTPIHSYYDNNNASSLFIFASLRLAPPRIVCHR